MEIHGEHETGTAEDLLKGLLATRALQRILNNARRTLKEVEGMLNQSPTEVHPPEGMLFAVRSIMRREVTTGTFSAAGSSCWGDGHSIHNPTGTEISHQDPPYYADRLVVVGNSLVAVNPDGTCRESDPDFGDQLTLVESPEPADPSEV